MKNQFYYSLFIGLAFLIAGCSKKGCTDVSADNYNYLAKKDDGSCVYSSANLGPKLLYCSNWTPGPVTLTDDPNRTIDYLIDCEQYLDETLTIEPGVVIAFTENSSLQVSANVTAIGTSSKKIKFIGYNGNNWYGMTFGVYNSIVLDNVEIINAGDGGTYFPGAIYLKGSPSTTVSITNSIISGGNSDCGIVQQSINLGLDTTGTTFLDVSTPICP